MRIVVIGLGSELRGDDAAGLVVVDLLARRISADGLDFKKCYSTGFGIMEALEGYDSAIIVDTLVTGLYNPGEIFEIDPEKMGYSTRISSLHDFDLFTSIELGRRMDLKMPDIIKVYGIEIRENHNFSEDISWDIMEAIKRLVEIILEEIQGAIGYNVRPDKIGGCVNG